VGRDRGIGTHWSALGTVAPRRTPPRVDRHRFTSARVARDRGMNSRHPHTVLLVDDNEVNRYLAKFALEQAGFRVITAADGAEALRQAIEHRPSLVLMDLLMPVMDGYEATQRLKADPQLHAIPVAVQPQQAARLAAAGCLASSVQPARRPSQAPEQPSSRPICRDRQALCQLLRPAEAALSVAQPSAVPRP